MTITLYPVDAVSGAPLYTGEKTRQALSVLCGVAPAGRPLGANSGVRPGTPSTTVTVSGSTATIGPHAGLLDLETSAAAGAYLYANDANTTKTVNAADATNPRIDLISVRLDDPAESDGSTVPAAVFVYTAGTAASSPSPPATPARSLALAQINVPASGGGSSTVTWVAVAWNQTLRAYMTNTSGQTIPDSSFTTVTGWTPTDVVAALGTYSTGLRTIAVDGFYVLEARISFPSAGSPAGQRAAHLIVNGTSVDLDRRDASSGHVVTVGMHAAVPLHVGDTVAVQAFQSQGSGQALTIGDGENHWSITRIGPI